MRRLGFYSVLLASSAAQAQFGFVQRIEVPPPAKSLNEWIAPGIETAHFRIRSESIMAGSREELGAHLEGVHGGYLSSLGLSGYMGGDPLASPEAAEKAISDAEGEGHLLRETRHARVRILPDRTVVSTRDGEKKVVTFPDGSRATFDGESWNIEKPSDRLRGKCDVWLLPTEGQYRAFLSLYYPDRNVITNAFYDHDADKIVAWDSPDHKGAITGELARRLLSCAFGATPPWLEEGLSRLTHDSRSGEVRPLPVESTRKVRYMILKGAYVSLAKLIQLNSAEFYDTINRPLYALQSGGVTEFLMRVDGGRRFHSFLRKLRQGVRAKEAFKGSFGGTRKAEDRWLDYLVNASTRVTPVEGLSLLRTERFDPGAGRAGNMFTAGIRQKRADKVLGIELWVYMVVRPRNAISPEGKFLLGRWTFAELPKGVKKISGKLKAEEKKRWGDHADAVRAELYWNGVLIDVNTNGAYTPLEKWWMLMEPVKWLNR